MPHAVKGKLQIINADNLPQPLVANQASLIRAIAVPVRAKHGEQRRIGAMLGADRLDIAQKTGIQHDAMQRVLTLAAGSFQQQRLSIGAEAPELGINRDDRITFDLLNGANLGVRKLADPRAECCSDQPMPLITGSSDSRAFATILANCSRLKSLSVFSTLTL
jgi:hypothetical protein